MNDSCGFYDPKNPHLCGAVRRESDSILSNSVLSLVSGQCLWPTIPNRKQGFRIWPVSVLLLSPVWQPLTQSVKQLSLAEQVSEPLCCVAVQLTSNRTCKVTSYSSAYQPVTDTSLSVPLIGYTGRSVITLVFALQFWEIFSSAIQTKKLTRNQQF
jgi:hypothetical protein